MRMSEPRAAASAVGADTRGKVPKTPGRLERSPLSPRLKLIVSASKKTADWVINLKEAQATSVTHVANLWDSAEEFSQALAHCANDVSDESAWLWGVCNNECERQAQGKTSLLQAPVPPKPAQDPLKRKRCEVELPATSIETAKGSLVISGASSDDRQAGHVVRLVSELWKFFLAPGSAGCLWEQFAALSPELQEEHARLTFEAWSELPLASLRGAVACIRRWRLWAARRRAPWKAPLPIHVALWLRSLKPGGPTAAHGVYYSLRWLERNLGFIVHTDSRPLPRHRPREPL